MFSIIKRNKQSFVVAAVAAVVLGGGAYAAIPAGDGTITACFDPNNPNLRVLDTAKATTCPAGQEMVNWSQKGPKGDGFKYTGAYDMTKDRANGYEVGDVVYMYAGCTNSDY